MPADPPDNTVAPRPAPLGRRLLAATIDGLPLIVMAAIAAAVSVRSRVTLPDGSSGYPQEVFVVLSGLTMLVVTAWVLYMTLASRLGRPLGKRLTGLRVVMLDGQRLTWQAAFLRETVFKAIAPLMITGLILPPAILLIPVFLAVPMVWHRTQWRAAHDVLSGTLVMDERTPA